MGTSIFLMLSVAAEAFLGYCLFHFIREGGCGIAVRRSGCCMLRGSRV